MTRGRFEPGARCVVIGEDRGYECNIGAMLTLVALQEGVVVGNGVPGGVERRWTFKDADRPLLVAKGPDHFVRDSTPFPVRFGWASVPAYLARHLLPIGGEGLEDDAPDAKSVKLANGSTIVFADQQK